MFCFGLTLLLSTGCHNDAEIEEISNYNIVHLKNFNFRLEKSLCYIFYLLG